ncbi:MAG: SDR family oxidoreductase [Roseibacillus sp.]
MRILLTGTTGKVGGFLARYWQDNHEVISLTRKVVDLTDTNALESFLQKTDFDLLVNPAAISTPEGCENNPDLANQVNVHAPATMAEVCAHKERPLIHFSTDYVLDGQVSGFKDETADCYPNNIYGKTKLSGEQTVLDRHPAALVARVSWVFGSNGESFLEKVLRQIKEGTALEGVADKYSMPTSAREMARALDFLLARSETGLFHITHTADEPVSWHSYAVAVADAAHQSGLTPAPLSVTARSLNDIPALRANRPIHTAMSPTRLLALGFPMKDWQVALRERVDELT